MNVAAPAVLTEPSRADLMAALEGLEASLVRLSAALAAGAEAEGDDAK